MKSLIGAAALALLLAGCNGDGGSAGGNTAQSGGAPVAEVKAPNGDWTEVVTATPEGGFRMGNPNAPVRLVEYASLSCPHCAEFSEAAGGPLRDDYVKGGQVSWEFRPFLLFPTDAGVSMLLQCRGPGPFFRLADQLYAEQAQWMGRIRQLPPGQLQQIQTLPPIQQAQTYVSAGGLDQFFRQRGMPQGQVESCLSNQQALERLAEITQRGVTEGVQGTPTFFINGQQVENAAGWKELEPAIRGALG